MEDMNIGSDEEEQANQEVEENDDIDDLIAKMEKVTIEKPEEMKKWLWASRGTRREIQNEYFLFIYLFDVLLNE